MDTDGKLAEIVSAITRIDIDILDLTPERQQWERVVAAGVREAYRLGRSAGKEIEYEA
jgi:chorismate mutase